MSETEKRQSRNVFDSKTRQRPPKSVLEICLETKTEFEYYITFDHCSNFFFEMRSNGVNRKGRNLATLF